MSGRLSALGAAMWMTLATSFTALAETPDRRSEPLVDVAKVCPSIVIELRYATERNIAGHLIYPRDARCLIRASVAERLKRAQAILAEDGLRLKIWDAYRPPWAQAKLWKAAPNPEFVADPARGGSFHEWGIAVDATLVDRYGRELRMPTDFDDFTPAAARVYRGDNRGIAANLKLLQNAMRRAGFLMMRDEWWHFVAGDFRSFSRVEPVARLEPEDPKPQRR
jgi:zinc D-Ala-D-Ala dipeptidase